MSEFVYNPDTELVRLVTAGSVDDGKSTLIGRLFYDSGQIYEDHLNAMEEASKLDDGSIDFSLFTDGLSAEREQGITIDVAYRYFSSKKRRFIIADVPGHTEYTRNMVTGASQAQVALLLVDARKGFIEQSKRHLFLTTLLRVPHIMVVINKMDMVDYAESEYDKIKNDIMSFSSKMQIQDIQFIPVSSLKGDMIVERLENMPWYNGWTVLDYLEQVEVSANRNLIDFRFPVQYVIRPDQDTRGYAGTVHSGTIRVGDRVKILPSKTTTTVSKIMLGERELDYAFAPQSVMIFLSDEVDVSRGNMIARAKNIPDVSKKLEAMVSWFSPESLAPGKRYILKHTTVETPCTVERVEYTIDIETLHRNKDNDSLELNDIGRVQFSLVEPALFDAYQKNPRVGSFILVDPDSFQTVGAGMISRKIGSTNDKKNPAALRRTIGQKGAIVWCTGLSGAGKTTVADAVHEKLSDMGYTSERLDGDILRSSITADLGFGTEDRKRNVAIAGYTAGMMAKYGVIVIASFISPYSDQRDALRKKSGSFVEVFVDTPLELCEKRDAKGLYKKARAGEIKNFTGIDDPYEAPENPEVHIDGKVEDLDAHVQQVLDALRERNIIE